LTFNSVEKNQNSQTAVIAGLVSGIGLILLVAAAVAAVFVYQRRKGANVRQEIHKEESQMDLALTPYGRMPATYGNNNEQSKSAMKVHIALAIILIS
jgi:hypothetical protein